MCRYSTVLNVNPTTHLDTQCGGGKRLYQNVSSSAGVDNSRLIQCGEVLLGDLVNNCIAGRQFCIFFCAASCLVECFKLIQRAYRQPFS